MAKTKKAKTPKAKKNKPAKAKAVTRSPRQPKLPGQEDATIDALESCVADMADITTERESLNKQELAIKVRAAKILKEHGKVKYHKANGLSVEIKGGVEKVTIKLPKPEKDASD